MEFWPRAPGLGLGRRPYQESGFLLSVLRGVAAHASLAAGSGWAHLHAPSCSLPSGPALLRVRSLLSLNKQFYLQQQDQQGIFMVMCWVSSWAQSLSPACIWERGRFTRMGRERSGWQGARTQKAPCECPHLLF